MNKVNSTFTLASLVATGLAANGYDPSYAEAVIEEYSGSAQPQTCTRPFNGGSNLCLSPQDICEYGDVAVKPYYTENARVVESNLTLLRSFRSFYEAVRIMDALATDRFGVAGTSTVGSDRAVRVTGFEDIECAIGWACDITLPAEVKSAQALIDVQGFRIAFDKNGHSQHVNLRLTDNRARIIGLFGYGGNSSIDPVVRPVSGTEEAAFSVLNLPVGSQVSIGLICALDLAFPELVQTVYQNVLASNG